MNYDLHPIFVHFPIAFFLLYSFLRVFPWSKKLPVTNWQLPRIVLLIAGLLGAWVANTTGEIASDLNQPDHNLVEMHEWFAGAATNTFFILLILEIISWLPEKIFNHPSLATIKNILLHFQKIISKRFFFIVLSIIGAVLIAMTGLLGGVMVYGTKADPLAAPVLKLLGL